ncbi:Alginate lyase [compost metagenome]
MRPENNGALKRLGERVLSGAKDPSPFKTKSGENQAMGDLKVDSKYAWLEPWCSLYRCSADALKKKHDMQPFRNFRLGGDLTRIYDPQAEQKK